MIKVLVYDSGREFKGRVLSLSSGGHGNTDVCAAVGGLMQTLAAYLLNVQNDIPESLLVDVRTQEGKFALDAIVQNDDDAEVQFILDTVADIAALGFMQLTMVPAYLEHLEIQIMPEAESKKKISYWTKNVRMWRAANDFNLETMMKPNIMLKK